MGFKHFRIDDRLIHGIVAGYWVNNLNATRLIVIDDIASKDQMIRDSLRMACPKNINLSVLDTDKAILNITNGNYDKQRIFVIAKSPITFLQLQLNNIEIKQVNMGNITYTSDRVKVTKTVSCNKLEIDALKRLSSKDTLITSQLIPEDICENFMELLKKIEN